MRIPRSISILGKKHKIKFIKCLELGYYGRYDEDSSTIYIDKTLDTEKQWRVLFHELTHGGCRRVGLSYTYSWNPDLEEMVCELNQNMFYELIGHLLEH